MKVLYIGNYLDETGWSKAATDYILALDSAGVDVVPRHIKLNNRIGKLPKRLLELQNKSSKGCDVVIQNVLPHQMDYNGKMLNIGLYYTETSHFKYSAWSDRLNCMDSLIVPNKQQVDSAERSGVVRPIDAIPIPVDMSRFQRSYEDLEILKPYKEQGSFLFYFIGETVRRKNLPALLKAFHLEFSPSEPVELVIKTDKPGISSEECKDSVKHFCGEIKRGLKLHGGKVDFYKQEIIITERLTDEGIMRLHSACDCFVIPSYGEAWCRPSFDAMAMGKTPIVPAHTGFLDYMNADCGWMVKSYPEPVFGEVETFNDLFVGDEEWNCVKISALRTAMRQAYEKENLRKEKASNGIVRAYDFSYEVVGPQFKKALEHAKRLSES